MAFYILFAIDLAMLIAIRMVEQAIHRIKNTAWHPHRAIYLIFIGFFVASFCGNVGYKISLVASIVYFILELFVITVSLIQIVAEAILK